MSRKSGLVFRELLVTGIMCYILAWLLNSFQLGTFLANCCHSLIKKDNDYDSIEDQTLRIGVILKNVASSSEKSQTLLLQFIIMIRSGFLLLLASQNFNLYVEIQEPFEKSELPPSVRNNSAAQNPAVCNDGHQEQPLRFGSFVQVH